MIGAKPIEADCMALVIRSPAHPPAVGKIYRVVEQRIDEPFAGHWMLDITINGSDVCAPERNLMRIDDPEIQEQIEDELEVVV